MKTEAKRAATAVAGQVVVQVAAREEGQGAVAEQVVAQAAAAGARTLALTQDFLIPGARWCLSRSLAVATTASGSTG